jgi:muconolactone delta-isomerase
MTEFLVEFQVDVPDDAPEGEVSERKSAEAAAAARLADEGHLLRVWNRPAGAGVGGEIVGL